MDFTAQKYRLRLDDKGAIEALISNDKNFIKQRLPLFEFQLRNGEKTYNAKIMLTDSGKRIANALAKRAMDAVFLVGGDLDFEEREVFYTTLEKISRKLEILSENGIPKW